ncbi:MAG: DNA lyase [Sideroxydans sp.]|nr:DNA lyase [Sideroxydans sp.]
MRLWSLHPRYLDARGLVALWREALLAQKVLAGHTRGYRNHPQLNRFRQQAEPQAAIAAYLSAVQQEAVRRGYNFDAGKIAAHGKVAPITVNDGQLAYELAHLQAKLAVRDPVAGARLPAEPEAHPLFRVVPGGIEEWEVV